MTRKKKLKRAIRAHARKSGTSYSTARRAFGVSPPDPLSTETHAGDSEPPIEVVRRNLQHDVPGEFITLRLPDRRITSIAAPAFTVGYAVVGDDGSDFLPLRIDVPTAIVFCRTTSREEWPRQVFRIATEQYLQLDWRETSAIQNPPMNGAPTRYWAQWLTLDADGRLTWERGRRGLHSLDDILDGRRGPLDDPGELPAG